MKEFIFIARVMILTVLIVVVLQLKWGEDTLETRASSFVTNSSTVKMIRESSQKIARIIKKSFAEKPEPAKENNQ